MKYEVDSDTLRRVLDELRFICPRLNEGENTFKINDDGIIDVPLMIEILKGIYPSITLIDSYRMPHRESRVANLFTRWFYTITIRVDLGAYQHTFDTYYGKKHED